MRKIFANLKSVVALAVVAAMTLSVSCMYDDTALTKRVDKVEKSLAALTEKVNGLSDQEGTLDSLLAGKLVITGVTTNEAGNTVVTLSNGESFTVLAEANTLKYRTENGALEISVDGETWVAVTANAACLVKEVRTNENGTVTVVFADGTEFTSAVAELIECAATRTAVYVLPESTKAVPFTINDAVEDINVMNQPLGWTATVEEYVEVEEPDYGGGVMPLAVGGKEYVLNITGPAKDFAQAAKEGVISVHFNTAAGACKVMNVAVSLAELTLSIENGVVTLTNSVAYEQTNRWGETYTDFADFAIGVMEASAYKQYGDKVFVETFDEWDGAYLANVNFTHRTSGFQNVVDLMYYEDVNCEKESYTFTVEQLANMLYPIYNFELGGEYIIFVTFDTELVNYYEHPVLTNALMVDYKNTVMSANYVSSTTNGAVYEFNLAGYTHYILGWVMKQELDQYIEWGVVSSLAEYLSLFAADMGGVCGLPGTLVAGPLAGTYNLADLESMLGWTPEMYSDTEYCFYIYPLNIESEMDLYAAVDAANVFEFGTFTTAGLVAGDFDAIAEYEVSSLNVRSLVVNAYFNEDAEVTKFAYEWFEGPALDQEERIATMLENAYFRTVDEYNSFVEAEYYSPVYPAYLGIIAVNAAGEYVYEETVYEYVESYNFEIEFTSADFVDGVLKFQGADANDYLDVIVNPGLTSIVAGEYAPIQPDWFNGGIMPWSSADALEFDGSNSKFNLSAIPAEYGYYLTEYGKMTVALEGDVYNIVITDLGYIDGKYQPVKFTFNGQFGAAKESAVVFTSATAVVTEGQPNWHNITFANDTDTVVIRIATYGSTNCLFGKYTQVDYGMDCCINGYTTSNTWNGVELWPVAMNVVDNGDGTLSVTIEATEYGGNYDSHVGTFTGVIEGLTFAHPEVAPEFTIPGDGVNYELELRYTKLVDGLDAKNAVRVADENGYTWDICFNSGLSSIEAGDYKAVNGFTTADALEVDTYSGGVGYGDSKYLYVEAYDDTTINVQKNGDWYCITLICTNGADCYDCPVTGAFRVVYIGKLVK